MKTMLALIITAVMLSFTPFAAHAKDKERLSVDPVLRGVWVVHMASADGGKTVKKIDPPEALCRVSALRIRLATGQTFGVEKVIVTVDENGDAANIIMLSSGVAWYVHKEPGQTLVVVQVYQPPNFDKEVMRFLVTVER